MQNFVVIGRVHFKPEHCKFWLNFEFDQSIIGVTWVPDLGGQFRFVADLSSTHLSDCLPETFWLLGQVEYILQVYFSNLFYEEMSRILRNGFQKSAINLSDDYRKVSNIRRSEYHT